MKKYKLIKKLPFENSPEIGYVSKPKSDDAHYWNHNWFYPQDYPEFWQEVVEKDYEIVSLKNNTFSMTFVTDFSKFTPERALFYEKYLTIYSVKRLSDGEIFTVGDNTKYGCIDTFYIKNNYLMVTTILESIGRYLKDIILLKKPLFTTEDGVDIYNGTNFWNVSIFYILNEFQVTNDIYPLGFIKDGSKQFSIKEKAEEYILMNKPCISLKEVLDNYNTKPGYNTPCNLDNELIKLIQQKLK